MSSGQYSKILVPLDGSKNSFLALEHAVKLAESLHAEIGILHVTLLTQQIPIVTQLESAYIPESIISKIDAFAKHVVKEGLAKVPEGIKVQSFCEVGSPTLVIPEFAEEHGYDMIVIGSRGLGVISGFVMGSVSNYVVQNAKCPVLVVK